MGEPERVTIQYILLSFRAPERPDATSLPTREEAEPRARGILERARAGENFDRLVEEFSDDRRRPPESARRRIRELYLEARKTGAPHPIPESEDPVDLFSMYISMLLGHGKDFDSIRAAYEEGRKHMNLRPEVKEDLNRRFAGLGDDLDAPYPRVFTEVLWLTRDRAVFDELLRDCDRSAPADPFTVVNHGISPASDDQVERSEVIKSWADLAFRLEIGEIGFISPEPGEFPAFAVFHRIR